MTLAWNQASKLWCTLATSCLGKLLCGCGEMSPAGEGLDEVNNEVIYDTDSRVEYYDAERVAQELTRRSVVVLAARASVEDLMSGNELDWSNAPSVAQTHGLCGSERFALQPSIAFCTGVLVDLDVILTAGHCTRVLAVDDVAVLFDYYYDGETIALSRSSIAWATEILSEGLNERHDFAWVRISPEIDDTRRVVPIARRTARGGESLLNIGASYGAPLKIDSSAVVVQAREAGEDFFVADTDTAHGASGGGVFSQTGELLGVLASGADDFVASDAGCVLASTLNGEDAEEEYTHAFSALGKLCETGTYEGPLCPAGDDSDYVELHLSKRQTACSMDAANSSNVNSLATTLLILLAMSVGARRGSIRGSIWGVSWRLSHCTQAFRTES